MTDAIITQKAPYVVNVEAGKTYHWCACGRSATQPFCDGAHQGTGITPVAFTAEKTEPVYLCGCRRSRNGAFCDGTHKSL
ncbi:MAG: CDGSH iron-sulfur domain-containing protein [Alphaproteobacteria bacterium]